jgi:hypothetical protein
MAIRHFGELMMFVVLNCRPSYRRSGPVWASEEVKTPRIRVKDHGGRIDIYPMHLSLPGIPADSKNLQAATRV